MTRTIVSSGLTTCAAVDDGAVRLAFVDEAGRPVSVEFPFAQAQSIAMTLPHLLSRALRRLTGNEQVRFVFRLGQWSLEAGDSCAILPLSTEDGFEVSFGLPLGACRATGDLLAREGGASEVASDSGERSPGLH